MRVAVLPPGEDREGVLPADEPGGACPHPECHAGRPAAGRARLPRRWARPNARFQELCELAGIAPRANVETGRPELWELMDLRKTCATDYDAHVPESSVEILGHSVGGSTYRHYAHRAPLAFKAIKTLPPADCVRGTGPRVRRGVPVLPAVVRRCISRARYRNFKLTAGIGFLRRDVTANSGVVLSSPIASPGGIASVDFWPVRTVIRRRPSCRIIP